LELNTIIEGALYAIHWEDQECNSLDQMAILYSDVSYLKDYFNKNSEKFEYYKAKNYSLEEAVSRTIKEAAELIEEIKNLALENIEDGDKSLDDLFKPLHTPEAYNHRRYHTDVKAKGYIEEAPWIRIYAIKCDDNLYVITGFGIKLVRDMRDDLDLSLELNKLQKATEFLDSLMMINK